MDITQTEIEEVLHMLAETPERITAFSHVRRMALHESGHCDQIESLLEG